MSLIDQAMKANEQFARSYDPKLGGHPQPKIAIVTCMDPRLSDLEGILGLKTADMDVIRTGGPAVTDDVLGELVVSTRSWAARRSCSSTTRAAGSQPSLTRS
jgi:carbonic anhydrase